jgi:hypothetical protein
MSPLSRQHAHARWPFWLLILAWVCANSPQVATYALLTWIGEARSFSHQQRLTAEVAHVLTGTKATERTSLARNTETAERPFAPLVPVEATLKKIQLAMEETTEVLPPEARAQRRVARLEARLEAWSDSPPHEPPRAQGLS